MIEALRQLGELHGWVVAPVGRLTIPLPATEGAVVRFRYGNELIRLRVQGAISHSLLLPHGYEGRRGLCGLLRLDLRDPTETLRYRLSVGR